MKAMDNMLFFFFFVYAFLGWCVEVIYAAVHHGKFVNRGFLNGPVCPIYGIGVTLIVVLLSPLKDHLLLLFVGSVILTSLLEFIAGWVLEKLFKQRWWDYSHVRFNIKGYICLRFSLIWGSACVVIVHLVHPVVEDLAGLLSPDLATLLSALFFMILTVDLAATVQTVNHLNKQLAVLNELGIRIRDVSDRIGETVSDGSLSIMEKGTTVKRSLEEMGGRFSDQLENAQHYIEATREKFDSQEEMNEYKLKQHLEELVNKRVQLMNRLSFGERRILRAFPKLKSFDHKETLEELKKRLLKK